MKFFILLALTAILSAVSTDDNHEMIRSIPRGIWATEGQFPYQVGIYPVNSDAFESRCSGSLIDSQWVLTAAHCIDSMQFGEVRLGSIYSCHSEISYNISKEDVIEHEGYDLIKGKNDIALIKIPKVEFTPNTQKVNLPEKSSSYTDYTGEDVFVSGWDLGGDVQLEYTNLRVISNEDCAASYPEKEITPGIICASSPNVDHICIDHFLGPMILSEPKILIGVYSFSSVNCDQQIPEGFTRVTNYLDWIEKKTGIAV